METNKFISVLEQLKKTLIGETILFHTDVGRLWLLTGGKPRKDVLDYFMNSIQEVFHDTQILFPTFNYDFPQSKQYDVLNDKCQVGALNEYIRVKYPDNRTLTPIFNFVILNNKDVPYKPEKNPFGWTSTFGYIYKRSGRIAFLGTDLASSNTFEHFVEEAMNIGYRYIKQFKGCIRLDGEKEEIILDYRVRPLLEESELVYDWQRLTDELYEENILHKIRLGGGYILYYDSNELAEFWWDKIRSEEMYLLTPESHDRVQKLYDRYGQPLVWKRVEINT